MSDSQTLNRTFWLEAGQRLLKDDGPRGVKLRRLAAVLNISTGSFYHHFDDFDDFLGALAAHYSGRQLRDGLEQICQATPDPYGRLLASARHAQANDLPRLAVAMRAWAQSEPRALDAVRALDQALLAFFSDCLTGMGHDADSAAMRAHLLLVSASVDVRRPGPSSRDAASLIEFICKARL